MKKILTVFLVLTIILSLSAAWIYYDSYYIAPTDFKVTTLKQNGSEGFEDISIMFFSDLQYGDYFTADKLEKLAETVSRINGDIVVFGGDLFDQDYSIISSDISTVTSFLKDIDAPLGKFYILGDYDCTSQTREVLVKKIMDEAGFQLIEDWLPIYNGTLAHRISFYSCCYNQNSPVNPVNEDYSICFVHNPNALSSAMDLFSLVLMGDSHEMQTSSPFTRFDYPLGQTKNLYRVSSIGTGSYYRLFNNPQILLINFS